MADAVYNVAANFRIHSKQAQSGINSVVSGIKKMQSSIRGAESGANSLVGKLALMGGAYLGIGAVVHGFRAVVGQAVTFNAELEKTKIGLSAVIGAVDKIPFADAQKQADGVFNQLRHDALKSTATTRELFDIYQGIIGPIRGAGFGLETVREVTLGTVAAASALNVDFAQAQRDIGMMASGVAGVDVKLFRMLKSTGAIAEDAQAWNALSAPERINKLQSALGKFEPAAAAYGESWAGVTSTFSDIRENLLGAATRKPFEAIRKAIASINERILKNFGTIEAGMEKAGAVMAGALEYAFARIAKVFTWVTKHWTEITHKIQEVAVVLKTIVPKIGAAALLISGARKAAGLGLGVAATGASMAGKAAGLFAGGSGAAAGGAGAAAAAGATLSAGAMVAVWTAVAAVFVTLAGVGVVIAENWDSILSVFYALTPTLDALWLRVKELGAAIWAAIGPIVRLFGIVALTAVWTAFKLILQGIFWIVEKLTWVFSVAAKAMKSFGESVNDVIDIAFGAGKKSAASLSKTYARPTDVGKNSLTEAIRRSLQSQAEDSYYGKAQSAAASGAASQPVAKTINDFTGAKIEVKQEFRDADPDRIAIQMFEDISRQVDMRTQSGFVPPLTR